MVSDDNSTKHITFDSVIVMHERDNEIEREKATLCHDVLCLVVTEIIIRDGKNVDRARASEEKLSLVETVTFEVVFINL